jgi:hypothetical protein
LAAAESILMKVRDWFTKGGPMNTTYLLFFAVFLGFYAILLLGLLFSSRLERRRRSSRSEARDEERFREKLLQTKS